MDCTAGGTLEVVIVKAVLVIVTVALAGAAVAASPLAVTVINFTLVLAGAVNKPLGVMLPALVDQITAVSLVLLTVAANCTVPPGVIETFLGDI